MCGCCSYHCINFRRRKQRRRSFIFQQSQEQKNTTSTVLNPSSDSDDYNFNFDYDYDSNSDSNDFNFSFDDESNHGDNPGPTPQQKTGLYALFGALSIFVIGLILVVVAISICFTAFVTSPLIVGCRRYFSINSFEKPDFAEVGFSFKKGRYMNIVKVEFLKNLFIGLWTLLFIIPGIIKAYEYYMVDYILTEDPTINYKDALEQSKQMMDGYKWATFVLELSFIGWIILSIFTCGLLNIFYVNPYIHATNAELFLFLRDKRFPGANPYYVPKFATAYGGPAVPPMNQGYNPQAQNYGQPVQNFGQQPNQYMPQQPSQNFGQPADPYGQPQQPTQDPYGAPQQPSDPYGMPQQPTQDSYGTPQQPADPYGMPQQPADPYGPIGDAGSASDTSSSAESSSANPSIDPDGYYNQ